jgi:hypothetical protein
MNPSIFVTISKEPGISSAERETIRYDQFVAKLLKELPEAESAMHIALGLAGELCELADVPWEPVDLKEEYGDFEFFLQAILTHYDINRSDCDEFASTRVTTPEFIHFVGKLLDYIKRQYVYNKRQDKRVLRHYIGNIYRFLDSEYLIIHTTRQEVLQQNAIKLETRYAGMYYSDNAAQTRADKN